MSSIQVEEPDLILMDIFLNRSIDGIEIAKRIRSQFDIPHIFITGCSDDSLIRRALDTEPLGYLFKPFNDEELKIAVEIALIKAQKNESLKREISELEHVEAAVKRRLEFEKTISTISARFISTLDVDEAVEKSLEEISLLRQAYRAYIFLLSEDGITMSNTHEWCAKGITSQKETMKSIPVAIFSKWIEKLSNGDTIHIKSSSNVPPESRGEKDFLDRQGIKSLLLLPLFQRGLFSGFIGFDSATRSTEWIEDDISILRVASDVIGRTFEKEAQRQELARHRLHLEDMVEERTKELKMLNAKLSKEIMERRHAEKSLFESEQRYRLLAENASDIIWTMDFNLKVTYVTPSVERLQRYSPGEIIGKSIGCILTADSYLLIKQVLKETKNMRKALRDTTEMSRILELKLTGKDGPSSWSEVKLTFLRDSKGKSKGFLGIARDITRRRQIEMQLRQSQKMEAIGRLAGGIAHDFNNLLTGIKGYSELALNEHRDRDDLIDDLKEINEVCCRAIDISRQLLLFSRKQPIVPTPVDINKVITMMLKMLTRLISEDITIITNLDPGLRKVLADEANIEQVMLNLVVNAGDAMPQGGTLSIETHNITINGTKTSPRAQAGEHVCLTITDTGVGMNKETIQQIFEPFFSTKESKQGIGLGLSVVYGIITQHNGWIDVTSSPGKGTTFKIYLPAVRTLVDAPEKKKNRPCALTGKGERILIVEDEEIIRKFASRTLTKYGYRVFAAATSRAALDLFEEEKGNFNLLFCDVALPDMSGFELVNALSPRSPGLQVVLTSGYAGKKSEERIISERGFLFLEKPYSIDDLLKIVRTAMPAG